MTALEVIRVREPISYGAMLSVQYERRGQIERGESPHTLYLLEHLPVITLGRKAERGHLLLSAEEYARRGIEVFETDRGGDVTYHGPGQLVAYPLLQLAEWQCSVGWYLRSLEDVVIRVLGHFGIEGGRVPGYTGVWVNGAKVAAIGVGVHQWVTFHGVALNVRPDMGHFGTIVPCGIADKPVTSMARLAAVSPSVGAVMDCFEREFRAVFFGR